MPAKKKTTRKRAKARAPAKATPPESETKLAGRLSKSLGGPITREMVREWKKKGYPLEDPPALAEILLAQHRPPAFLEAQATGPTGGAEPPTMAELRYSFMLEKVRKTAAEATIKEIEARAAKEKYMTRDEGYEAGRQIGANFRSQLLPLPRNLAVTLQGLTARQAEPRILDEVSRILQDSRRLMIEKGLVKGDA